MAKTFITAQINESPTITEKAGAAIDSDARGLFMKYDSAGCVVPASVAGEKVIGMSIITNNDSISKGQDVDIQVKEIGICRAGATIKKGDEVATGANGKAAVAAAGNFVVGTSLEDAKDGQLFYIQISKYYKPASQS